MKEKKEKKDKEKKDKITDELIDTFFSLPSSFSTKRIRTGDYFGDSTLRFSIARPFYSAFTKSFLYHSGIFVWIDGEIYKKTRTISMTYEQKEGSILCLLHQLHSAYRYNLLTGQRCKGGLILEPMTKIIERSHIIYCRNINVDDKEEFLFSLQQVLNDYASYPFSKDLRILFRILLGGSFQVKNGFTCSQFVAVLYAKLLNYPYGNNGNKTNFLIPSYDYSIYKPRDFLSSHNQSPIFSSDEFPVWKQLTFDELLCTNPVMIALIILCIDIILIIYMYFTITNKSFSSNLFIRTSTT
jgi:hypothetical protein